MGNIISFSQFQKNNYDLKSRKLIVFTQGLPITGKMISLNIPMAEMLITIEEKRRAKSLERCFLEIIGSSHKSAVVRDFDVIFNPTYRVDALKILTSVYKAHPFSVLWPGIVQSEKLIYANEGSPDYHVFDVKNYDIVCLI